MPNVTKII